MNRADMLDRVNSRATPWDMIIIGGGATGVGMAVDAAQRGYDVLLLEQYDFGKGTSSRSTKLIHGGVRYLEQGNLPLVMEALRERDLLRQNAPHLVHDLSFIVPTYSWWEAPFYGIGLTIYDCLAGKAGFGKSHILPKSKVIQHIPTIKADGLKSGVLYHDGQFDDTRLLINLVTTAVEQGATVLNYARVTGVVKDSQGKVNGVTFVDAESGIESTLHAKVVVNATGAFTDSIRRLSNAQAAPMIAPSQGVHLVFDRSLMPGDTAIMVPHTSDGRVMFVIPWHDHVLVGTTDTAIDSPTPEPRPLADEIEFILSTASLYLSRPPQMQDVLSVFVGIRPLVKAGTGSTKALSRDHTIDVDKAGLLTICGGKWTTYRRMAKDGVDKAISLAGLSAVACQTEHLKVHGCPDTTVKSGEMASYGSDAALIKAMMAAEPALAKPLHPALPYRAAEVVWAVRHEMCRNVEDFLARRVRALFLNAQAAMEMAPQVASLMAQELGRDDRWQSEQVRDFSQLASQYVVQKSAALVSQS